MKSIICYFIYLVYKLEFTDREVWWNVAKYRSMNTVYKEFIFFSKRIRETSIATDAKTNKENKKTEVANKKSWKKEQITQKTLYVCFECEHSISILVVGPTSSWQLLSNLENKINSLIWRATVASFVRSGINFTLICRVQ